METRHDADLAPTADRSPTTRVAESRRRGAGIALMLAASASNQTGAALGALAFPAIGPVGVVAVRQVLTALVLTAVVRPKIVGLQRNQWWPILGLAVVFSVMNLSLYVAISRIGLGLAVTLEFLGPLTVAIAGSRGPREFAAAAVAGAGVVVLTAPSPSTDVIGVALSLLAATAWGAYILLNRDLGQRLPGIHGTATASLVSAAAWTPIALTWFVFHPPTAVAIVLAVGCALLASVVPYVADLLALRRLTAQVFGTFTSVNPVWAALAGCLVLHQPLAVNEWAGIAMIVASNVAVCTGGRAAQGVGLQ